MTHSSDELPPEVAQEWRLLHEDAKERYKELSPSYMPALLVGIVVVLLVFVVGGRASGIFTEATSPFIAAEGGGTTTEITTTLTITPTIVNPTAPIATATATETAIATTAATPTEIAAAIATATPTATQTPGVTASAPPAVTGPDVEPTATVDCTKSSAYEVTIGNNGNPNLSPPSGTLFSEWLTPEVSASWVITNTKTGCSWTKVNLRSLSGGEVITPTLSLQEVKFKDSVNLTITLPVTKAASIPSIQWELMLNDVLLFEDEKQRLTLQEPWIIEGSKTQGCEPGVLFKTDVTGDDVVIQPGEVFTHTWAVKNVGGCDWNKAYKLHQPEDGGYKFEIKYYTIPLALLNEEVEISLQAVAPTASGTYTGTWHLYEGQNKRLGVVSDDEEKNFHLGLRIIVETSTEMQAPSDRQPGMP